jgi:hypothetical protein
MSDEVDVEPHPDQLPPFITEVSKMLEQLLDVRPPVRPGKVPDIDGVLDRGQALLLSRTARAPLLPRATARSSLGGTRAPREPHSTSRCKDNAAEASETNSVTPA